MRIVIGSLPKMEWSEGGEKNQNTNNHNWQITKPKKMRRCRREILEGKKIECF